MNDKKSLFKLPTRSELLRTIKALLYVHDSFGSQHIKHNNVADCGHGTRCLYCHSKGLVKDIVFSHCDGCHIEILEEDLVVINGFKFCNEVCWHTHKEILAVQA